MSRSCALLLAGSLLLPGCDSQIVLGDRESPLPVSSAGMASASAGMANASGGSASQSAGSGNGGGTAGQTDDVVPVPGELVWSTDHETGDASDWDQGGELNGGEYDWDEVAFDVEQGAGRNGSLGLSITIDTGFGDSPSHGVRFYRRIEQAPAFYTAWFRLEEAHTVEDWWSISLFHAREDPLSLDNDVSFWDVRVVDTANGGMALQFFDLDTMRGVLADARGDVAPGEWFELAFYVDYRPPDESRILVLRDGMLLFDVNNLHTGVEDNVYWAVGNGAGNLQPSQSTLYIDDASIRLATGTQ